MINVMRCLECNDAKLLKGNGWRADLEEINGMKGGVRNKLPTAIATVIDGKMGGKVEASSMVF